MATYTTEIASDSIPSDNPIHQRLLKAYIAAKDFVSGDLLELGCGEGRGVETLSPLVSSYTAIDKIKPVIEELQKKYPDVRFIQGSIPPLTEIADNTYDVVVSFQVIEHIKNDLLFLKEIYRVLKPGGHCIITTPNRKFSLTRNPWHVREYTVAELQTLSEQVFDRVEVKGIAGNEKVMNYHDENRESVRKITRFDILNLQYNLPRWMLRIPYDILNRVNRNKLMTSNDGLVSQISHEDYFLSSAAETCLDHFFLLHKSST